MGKYMPTENVGFNYKNILPHDGKDYWMVDYAFAIAIKRAAGVFDMIGDYVLVEPIREPNRNSHQGIIEIYNIEQEKDYKAIGKVISIGEPLKGDIKLSIKPNDIICSDIRYVEKYEIDGHDYWVIRQKYIYGKSVANEYFGNT
jgi:co-chaperonin GroES (HSP10)